MSKRKKSKYKPTVVKDGVDFQQFNNGMSAKEVEVSDNFIEEREYEKQQDPDNSYDYNARKKNQKR